MPLSRQISCLDLACCVGNKQSAYSVLLLAVIGFLLLHSPRRASTGEVCYRDIRLRISTFKVTRFGLKVAEGLTGYLLGYLKQLRAS